MMTRSLIKRLWKLPIPEYDGEQKLNSMIATTGATAAPGASKKLEELRAQRDNQLTVIVARRELRVWLRNSLKSKVVEDTVTKNTRDRTTFRIF